MSYEHIDMTNRLLLSYEKRKTEPIPDVNEYQEEQSIRVKGVKCNIKKNIKPLLDEVEKLLGDNLKTFKAIN